MTEEGLKQKRRKGTGKGKTEELVVEELDAPAESNLDEEIKRVLKETQHLAQSKMEGCGCGGNWI